jgi:hypothetical protein
LALLDLDGLVEELNPKRLQFLAFPLEIIHGKPKGRPGGIFIPGKRTPDQQLVQKGGLGGGSPQVDPFEVLQEILVKIQAAIVTAESSFWFSMTVTSLGEKGLRLISGF